MTAHPNLEIPVDLPPHLALFHLIKGNRTPQLSFLLFLMTLLIAPPAMSQPPDDKLIVPGVRIGIWTLQMTIKLVRMNGPAQTLDEDDPDFVHRIYEFHWQKPGLSLTAIAFDGQRVEVLLFDAFPMGPAINKTYKTDKGVGFLSSRQDVLRLYGQPTIAKAGRMLGRTNMIYDKIGIDFQVENNSVALVGVCLTRLLALNPRSAQNYLA